MQTHIQNVLPTLLLEALGTQAGCDALTTVTQDPWPLPWGQSSTRAQPWPQTSPVVDVVPSPAPLMITGPLAGPVTTSDLAEL